MKKKSFNITLLAIGVILIALSFIFGNNDTYKLFHGAFLGIGAGIIGLAFSNLLMMRWYNKHPNELKQAEIDAQDERSEIIRNKAKAKCSDIIQWVIMAMAWVTILADFPLWITLLLVSVFLLKSILELILMNKYNNQM